MKKVACFFILLVISLNIHANDGAYYTGGSTIYPMKEGKIVMEKEILSFKVVNEQCFVTIHFEFFNPESTSRKILVGFQAPQAAGDVSEKDIKYPQIFDFKVSRDNAPLSYQLKTADCEDCPLKDKQTITSHQAGEKIFVYLFEVDFKPGITVIDHSYRFRASSSVMVEQSYNYILKTGAKWAGGTINDLTVNFDLGDTYFYVADIFGKTASWLVNGTGKVTSKVYNNFETDCKMIRTTANASLQIQCKNWNPQQNLEFGIINTHCFEFENEDQSINRIMAALRSMNLDDPDDDPYTKEELKLIRNTFFAQKGYAFTNPELAAYFAKFDWYIPNPALKIGEIHLDEDVRSFIDEIQQKEKE